VSSDLTSRQRRWVFAAFAVAILFSMVNEWSAPVVTYCIRPTMQRIASLTK